MGFIVPSRKSKNFYFLFIKVNFSYCLCKKGETNESYIKLHRFFAILGLLNKPCKAVRLKRLENVDKPILSGFL